MKRISLIVGLMLMASLAHADKKLHLAFVLLTDAAMPNAEDIVHAYSNYAPSDEHLRLIENKKPTKLPVFQFEAAPGAVATVALMPAPVPKGEAEEAAKLSLSTLALGWRMPVYHAHLIVSLSTAGDGRPLDSLTRFTSVLAAVAEASRAVAVYWGDAQATHDAKFFTKIARSPKVVGRLTLWTGFSVAKEPGGKISLLSRGMKQLDFPDLLLVAPANATVGNAVAPFFDLLAMIVDEGKPLPEGDTVGRTMTEKWPVHYVPSPVDSSKKVCRVVMQ